MKYTTALLQLIVLTMAVFLFSTRLQAQSVQGSPRNLLGVELLGRGILCSFNYERLLTDGIGAGGGVALWSLSGGSFFGPSKRSTTLIVPTYVSWTPVGTTHSPYLAAGITVATSKTRELSLGDTRFDSRVFGALTAGYQYRSEGGIVIRPTVSHIISDGDNGFWPGITLGFAF